MESVRFVKHHRDSRRPRPTGRQSENLRNRITCAYSKAERAAIEWLNRTPEREELKGRLKALRGKPRREIAKQLSAGELVRLTAVHAAIVTTTATETTEKRSES